MCYNQFKTMKNVNITGIFLAMIAKFGVSTFEVSSIIPKGGAEPIDVMLSFKNINITLENTASEINEIVYENITGEVKSVSTTMNHGVLHIYIELKEMVINDDYAYNV